GGWKGRRANRGGSPALPPPRLGRSPRRSRGAAPKRGGLGGKTWFPPRERAEGEGRSYETFFREEVEDRLRCVSVVLDLSRVAARGRIAQRIDLRQRTRLTRPLGLDPELSERHRFLRLGLRSHDSLQRRITRLVDRVRNGDDSRQWRFDHVVAELRLPLDRQLPTVMSDLRSLRHNGQAEAVRDRRPQHGTVRVAGLLPEQDQIRAFALERFGQD